MTRAMSQTSNVPSSCDSSTAIKLSKAPFDGSIHIGTL